MIKNRIPAFTLSLGILILGLLVLLELIPEHEEEHMSKRSRLSPGTSEWDRWLKNTAIWSIYFFNTTNPDAVALGEKPKLHEFGPYMYEVTIRKANVEYHEWNGTVSYNESSAFRYLASRSKGAEEDKFVFPNIPLIAVARGKKDSYFDRYHQPALDRHSNETLLVTFTVAEILHKGKQSPLLKTYHETLQLHDELLNHNYKLGLFQPQTYYTRGSTSEVKIGREPLLREIGKLTRWAGMSKLSWNGKCGLISGSDGTIFPPHITESQDYPVFVPLFYRSVDFHFKGEIRTADGVNGYRFDLQQAVLEYPGKSDENSCFCQDSVDWMDPTSQEDTNATGKCPYNGTVGYPSYYEFDFIMSLPHFLYGAPELRSMVEGMSPDENLHQSYFELEPQSGLILTSHQRIQINLDILNPSNIQTSHVANFSETAYPILWFDRYMTDLADPFVKRALQGLERSLADALLGPYKWLLCITAAVLLVGSAIWIAHHSNHVVKSDTLLTAGFSAAE